MPFIQTGMTVQNRVAGLTGGQPGSFSAFEQSFTNIPSGVHAVYKEAMKVGVSVAMVPATKQLLLVKSQLDAVGEVARVNIKALMNNLKTQGWTTAFVSSEAELQG